MIKAAGGVYWESYSLCRPLISMGRKAKYCIFHSLEGSGNQNRNNERCGTDQDGEVKVNKKGEVAKVRMN